MKYLVDTNIWLERLLDQERSEDVRKFFDKTPSSDLCISDFSLHSIGIILTRFEKSDDYVKFIDDLFVLNKVNLVVLSPIEQKDIIESIKYHKLDFDDAYQYNSAVKNSLILISFDKDFENLPITLKDPIEVIS